jgi:hypothetical protein
MAEKVAIDKASVEAVRRILCSSGDSEVSYQQTSMF